MTTTNNNSWNAKRLMRQIQSWTLDRGQQETGPKEKKNFWDIWWFLWSPQEDEERFNNLKRATKHWRPQKLSHSIHVLLGNRLLELSLSLFWNSNNFSSSSSFTFQLPGCLIYVQVHTQSSWADPCTLSVGHTLFHAPVSLFAAAGP